MLVERGSATELAAALEVLIRNAGRRRELAMEGYRSFQRNFTWKIVHRRYREVLASLDRPEAGGPEYLRRNRHAHRSRSAGGRTMPSFSLILATSGRTAELHRFFSALEAAGDGDCECIVVDQNPDDRLAPVLAAWSDRVSIRHLRSSPGLSHARNVGLAVATGEVLAFPDDDCWYSPDLLREVRSFFVANPRYALLSAGVRDRSGRLSGNRWVRDRCDLATANLFRTSVGMALFVRRDSATGGSGLMSRLGWGRGPVLPRAKTPTMFFRLLESGLQGRFDRRLTVYHPRRDMLSGGANAVRAYSYGCGMGRVIRKRAKLPLLPAFVAFDLLRLAYSLLCGRPGPAWLCAAHGRGVFSGYMAAE